VKTIKITLITTILLLVLFLPAVQIEVPTAEACRPIEPVEVQEITGLEKQQIVDVLLNSPKFLTGVEWLDAKNIEVDASFDAIKVFRVDKNYIAMISQKSLLFESIEKIKIGTVFVALNERKEISLALSMFLKTTSNAKSLIIESLLIDSKESYALYMLTTRERAYKLAKPYETYASNPSNSKVTLPQPQYSTGLVKEDWLLCLGNILACLGAIAASPEIIAACPLCAQVVTCIPACATIFSVWWCIGCIAAGFIGCLVCAGGIAGLAISCYEAGRCLGIW